MIGAIIQARMTSTRLPGKVMMEICGRPVIDYLLERLNFCKNLQIIVLATTTNREDDPVADYVQKKGISLFRGSENDVVDRYYQAARQFGVTDIMRITADCPLVDPKICDHVIDTYFKEKMDFVVTGPTYAEGMDSEIFSFRALDVVYQNTVKKVDREYPTLYLHNHPELFKKLVLTNKTDDSKYRITIDEPQDFEVVSRIFKALYQKGAQPFGIDDVKAFLDANQEVFQMNSHIMRNEGLKISLKNEGELK